MSHVLIWVPHLDPFQALRLLHVDELLSSLPGGELLWIRYWTFGFHEMLRNYRVAEHLVASRIVLSSVELVSALQYRLDLHYVTAVSRWVCKSVTTNIKSCAECCNVLLSVTKQINAVISICLEGPRKPRTTFITSILAAIWTKPHPDMSQ
jgi:hypothetical protein